jgi:hypothetical protein
MASLGEAALEEWRSQWLSWKWSGELAAFSHRCEHLGQSADDQAPRTAASCRLGKIGRIYYHYGKMIIPKPRIDSSHLTLSEPEPEPAKQRDPEKL